MVTNEYITDKILEIDNTEFSSINHALESVPLEANQDLLKEIELPIHIQRKKESNKINPLLCIAQPKDASFIVNLYKEIYNGTYPYKEMEDLEAVQEMLNSPNFKCILFKTPQGEITGCVKFSLNFAQKRGYIRGFMMSKRFQGKIDVMKGFMGAIIGMWIKYHGKILVWYVENRTAHSKSQYAMRLSGLYPVGFYPNKDIFHGKVESDVMQVIYDEKALDGVRRKVPEIIPAVEKVFRFVNNRFKLEDFSLAKIRLNLNTSKLAKLKKKLYYEVEKDMYGYEEYKIKIKNSNSYIKFLHTPQVQNFEKTEYKVQSLEELFILAQEVKKIGRKLGIRYWEIFVSAYEPEHQQIFSDFGLTPKGYIPSWKYDKGTKKFEDHILFSHFCGEISENIKVIQEAKVLIKILGLM